MQFPRLIIVYTIMMFISSITVFLLSISIAINQGYIIEIKISPSRATDIEDIVHTGTSNNVINNVDLKVETDDGNKDILRVLDDENDEFLIHAVVTEQTMEDIHLTYNISSPEYQLREPTNGSVICEASDSIVHSKPMLTLFTTFYDNPEKFYIFNNTLTVWHQLQPEVVSILYVTPNENKTEPYLNYLINRACDLGWSVLISPVGNHSSYPILTDMFLTAYEQTETQWYCYANGDILFDDTLVAALKILNRHQSFVMPKSLIIGQRHDVELKFNTIIESKDDVRALIIDSILHPTYGIDYFITPRHGFPWKDTPPLIIGRPEIDNFLLWFARYHSPHIRDIDATDAILAMHQSTRGANQGWKHVPEYQSYNRDLINGFNISGTVYSTRLGKTTCLWHRLGHLRSPHLKLYKRLMQIDADSKIPCTKHRYIQLPADL